MTGDWAIGFTTVLIWEPDVIPVGSIIIWESEKRPIPIGWHVCNGVDGTPDLRNMFVLGAGGGTPSGSSGGSLGHQHDFTGDGHSHGITSTHDCPGSGIVGAWSSEDDDNETQEESSQGSTDNTDNLPPWYALSYIQRLF